MTEYVVPFSELGMRDVGRVGGKNASLGEMISQLTRLGVRVPDGFATTADAAGGNAKSGKGSLTSSSAPASLGRVPGLALCL